MDITVRLLEPGDVPIIDGAFSDTGWRSRRDILEGYLVEQQKEERTVFVAYSDHDFAGYVTVKWRSDYPPFAGKSIPEVMDLNVLPRFRRRRIATRLMDEAERLVFERSPVVGIGVGMFSDYGPAQRMYVRRGYVPDGLGLFQRGRHVRGYQEVRVDDDLVLYLTKDRRRKREGRERRAH